MEECGLCGSLKVSGGGVCVVWKLESVWWRRVCGSLKASGGGGCVEV